MVEPLLDEVDPFDERLAALERAFGKSADVILHSVVPFVFGFEQGGRADVVQFREYVDGTVYVTCDLLGSEEQVPNRLGTYELAICHRPGEDGGAPAIAALAYYTLQAPIEPGDTMDAGSIVPEGSPIVALLFEEFARFDIRGEPAGVLLCIGITADELSACRRGQWKRVLKALKSQGVYPFTAWRRRSALRWF